jgi:hypothetical protein
VSCGPGSSVGTATGYGLDGPGIESLLEARFSAPVHTVTGAHPASCTMGTGSFPAVESGRGVTLTPQPFQCQGLKKQSIAIPLLSLRAFVTYEKGETYLLSVLWEAVYVGAMLWDYIAEDLARIYAGITAILTGGLSWHSSVTAGIYD